MRATLSSHHANYALAKNKNHPECVALDSVEWKMLHSLQNSNICKLLVFFLRRDSPVESINFQTIPSVKGCNRVHGKLRDQHEHPELYQLKNRERKIKKSRSVSSWQSHRERLKIDVKRIFCLHSIGSTC